MNPWPLGPEPSAIPNFATPRSALVLYYIGEIKSSGILIFIKCFQFLGKSEEKRVLRMMPRYTKASLNFCRQGSNRNQITQARKALSSPHTGIGSLKLYYIRLFLTQLTGGFIIFAVCGWLRQKSQFVFKFSSASKSFAFTSG